MLEPITNLNRAYEFYSIDSNFLPIFNYSKVQKTEVFVYNNYFGICDAQTREIAAQCKNLIIDNSQAFYSKPIQGVDTFYSPRKFFGLPDGAYLYTDTLLDDGFETDISYQRFEHLLDVSILEQRVLWYFKSNDDSLMNQPIKRCEANTKTTSSIDYNSVAESRKRLYYLNSKLSAKLVKFKLILKFCAIGLSIFF